MAVSSQATQLTEAHRSVQARLGQQTVTMLHGVWPALDLNDLDGTFDRWHGLAVPIVRAQRTASARMAANYMFIVRKLELGPIRPARPVLAETVSAERLTTSLRVTGPVSLKSNVGRGMPLERAAAIADENSARAGMRYALDGGRNTIAQTTAADGEARGWTWQVTSDKPCDYCAGLDGVLFYLGEAEFKPHDGCDCEAVPSYFDAGFNPAGFNSRI